MVVEVVEVIERAEEEVKEEAMVVLEAAVVKEVEGW